MDLGQPIHNSGLFDFESEEFGDLNLMPLGIRYRLDCCGLKLSLQPWQTLNHSDKIGLLNESCESEGEISEWISHLQSLLLEKGADAPSALDRYQDSTSIPEAVASRLKGLGLRLEDAVWAHLSKFHRYVLKKMATSKMGDRYFHLALNEMNLDLH